MQYGTELFAELLVAFGFGAAEVEVAMQRFAVISEPVKNVEQGYGIWASTKGNIEHAFSVTLLRGEGKKLVFCDKIGNPLENMLAD